MTTLRNALKSGSALVGTLAILIGCSPTSPKLEEQQKIKPEAVKNVGGEKVSFNPRVDILFVVDDSGSMDRHQKNLALNAALFIDGLKNNQVLDYHVGVITTSMGPFTGSTKGDNGELVGSPAFVDRKTPDGLRLLQENFQVGTSGSASEMFFDPIYTALTPPLINGKNAGFYRSDAHLAVIFITDTEDQSTIMNADSLYQFLLGLKGGDKDKLATYGVFIPTGYPRQCQRDDALDDRLERFVAISNAKTFGICDPDFGQKLAGLADDLLKRVFKVMPLTRPPLPETIRVKYGTQDIPNDKDKGWVFDPARNALVFGDAIEWTVQPDGTELEVDFMAAPFKD